MSVSDDEREALHHILDYLLNSRDYLEKLDKSALTKGQHFYQAWGRPRRELFQNGSKFLRRIIGPYLHGEEMHLLFETRLQENVAGAELLATISNAIRSYIPLFMRQGNNEHDEDEEVIVKVIEDFMGMYWGDEPRFFSSWPRRQGLHKRPYRLARLRLSALNWDKYLAAVGLNAYDRHRIISDAFKTEWDAIRKWADSIREQFDLVSYPPENIDIARQEYQSHPDRIVAKIKSDGDAYWAEKSTALGGKD